MKAYAAAILALCLPGSLEAQPGKENASRPEPIVEVVVFLGLECPISQQYIRVLNQVRNSYDPVRVSLKGVVPGKVKRRDIEAFVGNYEPIFSLVADKKRKWESRLQPSVTPEVFVIDEHSELQYRGAIDNWYFDLGQHRAAPTENYLVDAVDELLRGRVPEVRSTSPVGCLIQKAHQKQ